MSLGSFIRQIKSIVLTNFLAETSLRELRDCRRLSFPGKCLRWRVCAGLTFSIGRGVLCRKQDLKCQLSLLSDRVGGWRVGGGNFCIDTRLFHSVTTVSKFESETEHQTLLESRNKLGTRRNEIVFYSHFFASWTHV